MSIIAVHQPEHLPWAGYFLKMMRCDIWVNLDCVQYSKNQYQNRNKIIDRNGQTLWITVPILQKGHTTNTIRGMKIANNSTWKRKYLKTILLNYSSYPFFKNYYPKLEEIIFSADENLSSLNISLIIFIKNILEINPTIIHAFDLNPNGKKNCLIIDLCKKLGGTKYISGNGAKKYINVSQFNEKNIDVVFNETPDFLPKVSIIDLLFRHGPKLRYSLNQPIHEKVGFYGN